MFVSKKITAAAVALLLALGSTEAVLDNNGGYGAVLANAEILSAQNTVGTPKIKAFSSTASSVKIAWGKVTGAQKYNVYRYGSNSKKWVKLGTVGAGTLSYTDRKSLSPCTVYAYKVKAVKNDKEGKAAASYYAVTKPKATKITATSCASKTIAMRWVKVKCSGYKIYKLEKGKYKCIKTVSSNTGYLKLTNLKKNTKYTFKIRAFYKMKSSGKLLYSEASPAKSVSTKTTAQTPVALHGRLSVKGNHIVDKNGKVFKIKGMSTHGIMWENYDDVLSYDSMKVLRDDWKINTIRVAMYTEEYAGYTTGSNYASQAKAKVTAAVENAKKLGLYVIIDWHILKDGNPNTHKTQAKAFFKEMAKKYKNYDNVIFEICNEPNGSVTWSGDIKPYCQSIVKTIRDQGNKNIIVCGTGTWSQDIDKVLGNRLSDKNCVYTLHFYANTHTDWLRTRLQGCYNEGLPVLVTEFGTCDASGNGGYNASQTKAWLSFLDTLKVGYVNWSLSGKVETASAFKSGTDLKKIKAGTSQLTKSGKLIRAWLRTH